MFYKMDAEYSTAIPPKYVYRNHEESDARLLKRYLHHIINLHPLYINMATDMSKLNRKDIEKIIVTYDRVVQNLISNLDWKS
jgi:hypothetical protein